MSTPDFECGCDLCQRHEAAEKRLALLPESERGYWEGIYELLEAAEMERDYNGAVIDGSWPDADGIIARAREPRYELTDAGRAALEGGDGR